MDARKKEERWQLYFIRFRRAWALTRVRYVHSFIGHDQVHVNASFTGPSFHPNIFPIKVGFS
jgi:hypothetical protein